MNNRKKNDFVLVILGATGDLAKKKLIPALYNMLLNRSVDDFAVVGVSLDDVRPDKLIEESRKYVKRYNRKSWESLKRRFYYFRADFYDRKRFMQLNDFVGLVEKKHSLSGNRMFYLATMPQHFEAITECLRKSSLAGRKRDAWRRVVFEKPFGEDLISAKRINKCIKRLFSENQIYRIDHYLGKELVQNISVVRFTNTVLEPLWNRKYIDHVQIILSEDFGVEGRGTYYDHYGALKDVVQNHMMQLLSLTAMEAPRKLTEGHIRDEKVKILRMIRDVKPEDVVLGQYNGYRKEKGVKKDSRTETFAALKMFVSNRRWRNIPFYLITGKNMKDKITSIYIQFKDAPCLLFSGICNFMPNYLVIQIQPEEGFYLQLNAKVPAKTDITAVRMDFCHECTFGPNTPEAYETLLMDVAKGDQSVFIRSDEIELEWRIIDKITKKRLRAHPYKKGSYPDAAKRLIQKDDRYWHLKVK